MAIQASIQRASYQQCLRGTPTCARIKKYFPLAESISWTNDVESVYICLCVAVGALYTVRYEMKRARYATRRFCHCELKKIHEKRD